MDKILNYFCGMENVTNRAPIPASCAKFVTSSENHGKVT